MQWPSCSIWWNEIVLHYHHSVALWVPFKSLIVSQSCSIFCMPFAPRTGVPLANCIIMTPKFFSFLNKLRLWARYLRIQMLTSSIRTFLSLDWKLEWICGPATLFKAAPRNNWKKQSFRFSSYQFQGAKIRCSWFYSTNPSVLQNQVHLSIALTVTDMSHRDTLKLRLYVTQ